MIVFGRRVALTRLLYTLVVLMSTATGQGEEQNATCSFHGEWSRFGQGDKDVCTVARELMQGTCQLPHIPPLDRDVRPKDSWYTASRFDDEALKHAKPCACERVMYNLLSACAGCQKWGWSTIATTQITWQAFKIYQDGCSNSTRDKRAVTWNPDPPTWAVEFSQDTFDPIGAQPTTSAGAAPGPTNTPPSTVNPAAETPSVTSNAAQSTSTSGPPIGAIVGGVIGGLILLGAIAGLAFWIHRRKRRSRDIAPSSEFLKPEYYASPPLLPVHERRDSAYRDEIEEDTRPNPTNRHSWAAGLMTTRRHEEDDDDCEMLPPFTQGTYIGPSPHEKDQPERRDTVDTDITTHTNNTTTFLLSSSSPTRQHGPSF